MKFPEKLRQMRKSAGLTHEQLANAVGLTRRTIIKYEQGDSLPRTDKIYMRIAEFFNVSVDYLKNDSEDDFAKAVEKLSPITNKEPNNLSRKNRSVKT